MKQDWWITPEDGNGYKKDWNFTGTWAEAREFGRQIAQPGQTVEITPIEN